MLTVFDDVSGVIAVSPQAARTDTINIIAINIASVFIIWFLFIVFLTFYQNLSDPSGTHCLISSRRLQNSPSEKKVPSPFAWITLRSVLS